MGRPVVVAVDIGGTKVEAAFVDADGTVLPGSRHRAATGRASSGGELDAAVLGVIDRVLGDEHDTGAQGLEPVGIGVATAGPLDERLGTVSPINLPGWRDHPVRSIIEAHRDRRLPGRPVAMHRDGVAIALAEHWRGAGRGVADMLGMVVSTGVGGGIVVGGRVRTGNAGHIGQIEVSGFVGEPSLGRRTTLESVASGPHVVAWARSQGFAGTTGEDLAAAYVAGDTVADRAVGRLADVVAQGIASAVALIDVELVVIGGGFADVADDLVGRIGALVTEHPLDYVARTRVVRAHLGGDAPLIGAAGFVWRPDLLAESPTAPTFGPR